MTTAETEPAPPPPPAADPLVYALWQRVRVRKGVTFLGEPAWEWTHLCTSRPTPANSFPFLDHAEAITSADRHARRCT